MIETEIFRINFCFVVYFSNPIFAFWLNFRFKNTKAKMDTTSSGSKVSSNRYHWCWNTVIWVCSWEEKKWYLRFYDTVFFISIFSPSFLFTYESLLLSSVHWLVDENSLWVGLRGTCAFICHLENVSMLQFWMLLFVRWKVFVSLLRGYCFRLWWYFVEVFLWVRFFEVMIFGLKRVWNRLNGNLRMKLIYGVQCWFFHFH